MQHMRSFTKESLAALLEEYGFSVKFCSNLDLSSRSKSMKPRGIAALKRMVKKRLNKTSGANYRVFPHLVAIVTK